MKVLLDECLPVDFRHHLPGHEVHTAEWAGFKGLKNGQLLARAEQAGYQTLITVDQGVPDQQNLGQRRIAILITRPRTNQLEDMLPLVERILLALNRDAPRQRRVRGLTFSIARTGSFIGHAVLACVEGVLCRSSQTRAFGPVASECGKAQKGAVAVIRPFSRPASSPARPFSLEAAVQAGTGSTG